MKNSKQKEPKGLTRREALKLSGLAFGGLALGSFPISPGAGKVYAAQPPEACPAVGPCSWDDYAKSQQYSYFFETLEEFQAIDPDTKMSTPLEPDEMRITFMGSCIPPVRRAQQMMSVFVEVGNAMGEPDQFVFDCGSGVCANYGAMGIGYARMNKVFIAHLHGDHMSDLTHIYCFGPSGDRKSPLYVWGPGPSGVKSPRPPRRLYDDGTKAFCKNLREACRWHSESFSFQTTSFPDYDIPTRESWGLPVDPVPVGDDPPDDGFAMVPIELDWKKYGKVEGDNIAYNNPKTGVKITHFPVIHARKASIGYKLEWNGLSMIYTSDTKPEIHSLNQASNKGKGVDVFIHEMVVPAQVWAMKNNGLDFLPPLDSDGVKQLQMVQDSSHTPQGAFGYLLSQIDPRPRLTVATHFPVADDTVACALQSVQAHCPDVLLGKSNGSITWSFDLMVLRAFAEDSEGSKPEIQQLRAVVSDYGFSPLVQVPEVQNTPKYYYTDEAGNEVGNPFAQIDRLMEIKAEDEEGNCNYRSDGY